MNEQLTQYEIQRLARIAENNARLEELGIRTLASELAASSAPLPRTRTARRKNTANSNTVPLRRSSRVASGMEASPSSLFRTPSPASAPIASTLAGKRSSAKRSAPLAPADQWRAAFAPALEQAQLGKDAAPKELYTALSDSSFRPAMLDPSGPLGSMEERGATVKPAVTGLIKEITGDNVGLQLVLLSEVDKIFAGAHGTITTHTSTNYSTRHCLTLLQVAPSAVAPRAVPLRLLACGIR